MAHEEQVNRRRKNEESQRFLGKQSPSLLGQRVQLADLVTRARGGGGIEGRGRGERERRRRRGSGVVAVCGIGTLGGSWRGWGWLNHPRQWSV